MDFKLRIFFFNFKQNFKEINSYRLGQHTKSFKLMGIITQFSFSDTAYKPQKHPQAQVPFLSKIITLLGSVEEKNTYLAFQLMSGLQEENQSLNSLCLGLVCFHPSPAIRKEALHFLEKQSTASSFRNWLHNQQKNLPKDENSTATFLSRAAQKPFIELPYLALALLRHRQLGVKYCLEHQLLPAQEVLSILSKGDWLSLENKQLTFLPPEIGLFTQLRSLNISGNSFTSLPEEIANLKNLDNLYFHQTPLSRYSLKQLQTIFPHIFSEKLYMQSIGFFEERNYHEALKSIDKALKLNPEAANNWNAKGLIFQKTDFTTESIKCFEKAIYLNPQDAQLYANITLSLLKDEKYAIALEYSHKGIELAQQNPQNGAKNLDLLYIYQGQALCALRQFESAEQSFYKSLQINADTGLAWYQLARMFAMQKHFVALTDCLGKAIQLNRRFLREAQHDELFKAFYHQKQLKTLLKAA